jgi:hypothetical protein
MRFLQVKRFPTTQIHAYESTYSELWVPPPLQKEIRPDGFEVNTCVTYMKHEGESVHRQQKDIKRKTCDIRT